MPPIRCEGGEVQGLPEAAPPEDDRVGLLGLRELPGRVIGVGPRIPAEHDVVDPIAVHVLHDLHPLDLGREELGEEWAAIPGPAEDVVLQIRVEVGAGDVSRRDVLHVHDRPPEVGEAAGEGSRQLAPPRGDVHPHWTAAAPGRHRQPGRGLVGDVEDPGFSGPEEEPGPLQEPLSLQLHHVAPVDPPDGQVDGVHLQDGGVQERAHRDQVGPRRVDVRPHVDLPASIPIEVLEQGQPPSQLVVRPADHLVAPARGDVRECQSPREAFPAEEDLDHPGAAPPGAGEDQVGSAVPVQIDPAIDGVEDLAASDPPPGDGGVPRVFGERGCRNASGKLGSRPASHDQHLGEVAEQVRQIGVLRLPRELEREVVERRPR